MKRIDKDEIYVSNEDNHFSEYKSFPAERYVLDENVIPPKEVIHISETYSDINGENKKENSTNINLDKLKDKLEDLSKGVDSSTAVTKATTITSITASASTGVIVGVIAVGIVSTSLFTFISKYLNFNIGSDYAIVEIDSNSILDGDSSLKNLSPSNIYIKFDYDCYPSYMYLKEGINDYLFTGFKPNKTYTYEIIANNLSNSETTLYSNKITTKSISKEVNVLTDNQKTYFEYDDSNETFRFNYSLYVSDLSKTYNDYSIYLTTSRPSDNKLENIIFNTDSELSEYGFIKGMSDEFTLSELYKYDANINTNQLYVTTTGKNKETNEIDIISTNAISLEIPSNWKQPKILIESENVETTSSSIAIDGNLNYVNKETSFTSIITQYDENLNVISSLEAKEFFFDENTKKYSLLFDACYGTKKYKYSIYSINGDKGEVLEYESGIFSFDENQSYDASYQIIDPNNMVVSFEEGKAKIEVDVGFTSTKDNLCYSLDLICEENVISTYKGKDKATFLVDTDILNKEIYFIYHQIGIFASKDITYESQNTSNYVFGYPIFNFDKDFIFEDSLFGFAYDLEMPFDYTKAKIKFYIDDGKEVYIKEVEEINEGGDRILLDMFDGEVGDVTITPELTYIDNQTSQKEHTIKLTSQKYSMNYSFNVNDVIVDMSETNSDSSTFNVKINLDNSIVPSDYVINIYGNDSLLQSESVEASYIELSSLSLTGDTNLKIDFLKEGENPIKTFTYTINPSIAKEKYNSPTSYNLASVDESLVTYNDDSTINLYRKIDFKTTDKNVCYNAQVYSFDDSGNIIETYDCISSDGYARIENIPLQKYSYAYYSCYSYNNVIYQMERLSLSSDSSSTILDKNVSALAKVSISSTSAYITITISDASIYFKTIKVNDVEYTSEEELEDENTKLSISIPSLSEVNSVSLYATNYTSNYASFSKDITIKGKPYFEIQATVEALEG